MTPASRSKTNPDFKIVLDSIRRIVRSVRRTSKFTEKTLGLSAAQIFVLQRLSSSDRPLSINELAEATMTHQSSVSAVVSKLVSRGLIERNPSSIDSRAVELSLSKQGEYLLSKSPQSFHERVMAGLIQMSASEREALVRGLEALIEKSGLQNEEATMLLEDDENTSESKKV